MLTPLTKVSNEPLATKRGCAATKDEPRLRRYEPFATLTTKD